MTISNKTETFTTKHQFNIVKGKSLAECVGKTLKLEAIAIGEDISNDTGEMVKTGYIVDVDGSIYTTVSKTARQQLEALIEMPDFQEFELLVCSSKCKNDPKREFVYFDML